MKFKNIITKKIIVFVEIFILWYLAYLLLNKDFLPNPIDVLFICAKMLLNGDLNIHILSSMKRILFGIFFATLFAIPAGIILSLDKKADRYLTELFNFLYTIPKIIFLPIIIVIMGIGDLSKIFLIALILFFQQAILIRDAIKNISPEFLQYFYILKATKWQLIYHLILPICIPEIITSLRASLGMAVALLFISENFAATSGMGYFITKCMNMRNYEMMYASIIILSFFSILLYTFFGHLEKKLCKWKFR